MGHHLTSIELWDLIEGLEQPPSRELEVEQLMQTRGLDRDEAELIVDSRRKREAAADALRPGT